MLQSDHRQRIHVDQDDDEDAGDKSRDEALRVAESTLLVVRSYPDKLQLMHSNGGAGIQIISATLMDEWREVANC